jgi:hypothetical protein
MFYPAEAMLCGQIRRRGWAARCGRVEVSVECRIQRFGADSFLQDGEFHIPGSAFLRRAFVKLGKGNICLHNSSKI